MALSSPRLHWMTGNIIGVDGGELIGERRKLAASDLGRVSVWRAAFDRSRQRFLRFSGRAVFFVGVATGVGRMYLRIGP